MTCRSCCGLSAGKRYLQLTGQHLILRGNPLSICHWADRIMNVEITPVEFALTISMSHTDWQGQPPPGAATDPLYTGERTIDMPYISDLLLKPTTGPVLSAHMAPALRRPLLDRDAPILIIHIPQPSRFQIDHPDPSNGRSLERRTSVSHSPGLTTRLAGLGALRCRIRSSAASSASRICCWRRLAAIPLRKGSILVS